MDLFQNFPISNLDRGSPIISLLRKPDFQRETNHWSPLQLITFLSSYLDNELIPAIILWKSPRFLFVIDGGHRLSALRAWMEDDYGDGNVSISFYGGEISDEQKKIAKRTRALVDSKIGKFSTLKSIVSGEIIGSDEQKARASRLFTRALALQWVQGNAAVAESSFFKINSQGTPLDDAEEMLLKNRRKPVAVGARAIVRSGFGHKYWSAFPRENQSKIEEAAHDLYGLLFDPEIREPVKTLDLPLGGTSSPIDAISLLVEFLLLCDQRGGVVRPIETYADDGDGIETLNILRRASSVMRRITGNDGASLGLHPVVYFYNEKGKHSRFLFLGMVDCISRKINDNNSQFYKKFSKSREMIEEFLDENKSLIGIFLQNTNRNSRVSKMRDMFEYLVDRYSEGYLVSQSDLLAHLGARSRVFDVTSVAESEKFTDGAKSQIFISTALRSATKCPECKGFLFPLKSISFDHVTRVSEGGRGDHENGQLMHPYCNTAMKN